MTRALIALLVCCAAGCGGNATLDVDGSSTPTVAPTTPPPPPTPPGGGETDGGRRGRSDGGRRMRPDASPPPDGGRRMRPDAGERPDARERPDVGGRRGVMRAACPVDDPAGMPCPTPGALCAVAADAGPTICACRGGLGGAMATWRCNR